MREIKFRAWSKVAQQIIAWEEIEKKGNLSKIINHSEYNLMQCTGLKDKNGKEIYEGEIIAAGGCVGNCKIVFKDGAFVMQKSDIESFYMHSGFTTANAIGNIYENPELLEAT